MLQPYGVHVIGDLAGGLVVAACWLVTGGRRRTTLSWLVLAALLLLSLAGSAQVVWAAHLRGDYGVLVYHGLWVVGSVWASGVVAANLRHRWWCARGLRELSRWVEAPPPGTPGPPQR